MYVPAYDRHLHYEMSGTRRAPSAADSLWDESEEKRLTYLGVMDGHRLRSKSAVMDARHRTPHSDHSKIFRTTKIRYSACYVDTSVTFLYLILVRDRPLTTFEPDTKIEVILILISYMENSLILKIQYI